MPVRMRLIWGSSFGFPGAKPVGLFKRYITHNQFEADHFYSAYPEATTTMVSSALALSQKFDAFRAEGGPGAPPVRRRVARVPRVGAEAAVTAKRPSHGRPP